MIYSLKNPPKNWKDYPESFLRVAIPVLNNYSEKPIAMQMGLAWSSLNKLGLKEFLAEGAYPEIKELNFKRLEDSKIQIMWSVAGNFKKYQYSMVLKKDNEILKNFIGMSTGSIILNLRKDCIISLNVRMLGEGSIRDQRMLTINLGYIQPSLF